MIIAALSVHGATRASTAKGAPLATRAVQAAREAPVKSVSVTPTAPCLCPATRSQASACAAQEPQGAGVTAASPAMHARAPSVFFVETSVQAFFSVTWLAWSRWP